MEIRPCRLVFPYRYVDPMESVMSNESCPKAQNIPVFQPREYSEYDSAEESGIYSSSDVD